MLIVLVVIGAAVGITIAAVDLHSGVQDDAIGFVEAESPNQAIIQDGKERKSLPEAVTNPTQFADRSTLLGIR